MRFYYVFFILLLQNNSAFSQNPSFGWAREFSVSTVGGTIHHISVDQLGNVYTMGNFYTSTTDFDPGPQVYNLTINGQDDIFITKYDPNGNFIWAKNLGSDKADIGTGLALDAAGNVYVTGYFKDTADFDPGLGVFNLICSNEMNDVDMFICKLSTDGNFVWAKDIGTIGLEIPRSISVDLQGNVYTTGTFEGVVDFDPGSGVFLIGQTSNNVFVSKLDINGNFIWARAIGNIQGLVWSSCVNIDEVGDVYFSGYFSGTIDFNPSASTYNLTSPSHNTFVVKLTSNGNFSWATMLGGAFPGIFQSIVIDTSFNTYAVYGNLLVKINNNGTIIWEKDFGGRISENSRSVFVDINSNIYVTGYFWQVVDFDPSTVVHNLTSFGYPSIIAYDSYIVKFNSNGDFMDIKQVGGFSPDYGYSIFVDPTGNIYSTGSFIYAADFDPGPDEYILYSSTTTSRYILKLNRCSNITQSIINASVCNSYTLNGQTYNSSGIYTQTLVNSAGCDSIITLNLTINGSNTTSTISTCDSYIWRGNTYTSSGFYSDTLTTTNGCDSILNLNLILHYKTTTNVNKTICQGESFEGYNTSGIYTDLFTTSYGCDSTRILNLSVNQTYNTIKKDTICEGESYFIGGSNQTISGIYRDIFQTINGCDSIIVTNLTVLPSPKPNLGNDGNICSNNDKVILNPGFFNTYLWQDNSNNQTFEATTPGKYWVKVDFSNNRCIGSDTINILAIDTVPTNFLPQDKKLCIGSVENINLSNYKSYLWSTGSTSNSVQLSKFGKYYLDVVDYNNCKGSDTINLIRNAQCIAVLIPNSFTPNGDFVNNIFKPIIQQDIKEYKFVIYNRYGQKVFETNNYAVGWDGKLKNKEQPIGSYLYFISFTNGIGYKTEEKGTVMLLR